MEQPGWATDVVCNVEAVGLDEVSEGEVIRQLQEWGIYDDSLPFDKLLRRYKLFSGLVIGDAKWETEAYYFKQLVQFEDKFAVDQGDVGCVQDYPFAMEVKPGKPIKERPIQYGPEQRAWVNEEVKKLLDTGIISEAEADSYLHKVVLVAQGQSGQDYRMCVDYRAINRRTLTDGWPCPDLLESVRRVGKGKFFSSIDLKAGYHNIPLHKSCRKYTGFVTQQGAYVCNRMTFGLKNAPSWFQKVVACVVDKGDVQVVIYLDDIIVFADTPQKCWEETMLVLSRLTGAGFMVNGKKCQFLVREVKFLGYQLKAGQLQPNFKKLQTLMKYKVPKTMRDVDSLYGLLSYFRIFVPNFARIVKPISDLKKQGANLKWTAKHSAAVDQVVEHLSKEARLRQPDTSRPFVLEVDHGTLGYGGVLLQEAEDGHLWPVGCVSKTKQGEKWGVFDGIVRAVLYALRKFKCLLEFCPSVEVRTIIPGLQNFFKSSSIGASLGSAIAEIRSFPVTFKQVEKLKVTQALELNDYGLDVDSGDDEGVAIQPHVWVKSMKQFEGVPLLIRSDGGFIGEVGTIGFVVYDLDGRELVRVCAYDKGFSSNQAELLAVLEALKFVVQQGWKYRGDFLQVCVDSQLVVKLMTKEWNARDEALADIVEEINLLRRKERMKVQFTWEPRAANKVADEMTRLATEQKGGCVLWAEGGEEVAALQAGDRGQYCDDCGQANPVLQSLLPMYCKDCYNRLLLTGYQDCTQDISLLHYLFHGNHRPGATLADQIRVTKEATVFKLHPDSTRAGRYALATKVGDQWLVVPALGERRKIVREYHQALRHAAVEALMSALKVDFWWPQMRQDCIEIVGMCRGCTSEKFTWDRNLALRPTDKPHAPFEGWSLDLITNLEPEVEGFKHCLVAVDCFSKWVEIVPLKNKQSQTLADWFYRDLIPRFGKPRWVRVDAGREFKKMFQAVCSDLGVTVRTSSSGYPRSNGQVERYNREIKKAVRKYAAMYPETSWFDWLPEVLMGLRMVATKSHGLSPFMVTYKQNPFIPGRPQVTTEPLSWDVGTDEEKTYTEELVAMFVRVREQIVDALHRGDIEMKTYHDRQALLDEMLQPGDKVFLQQTRVGKLVPKAEGPFTFVRYTNANCTGCVVEKGGKEVKVHASRVRLVD